MSYSLRSRSIDGMIVPSTGFEMLPTTILEFAGKLEGGGYFCCVAVDFAETGYEATACGNVSFQWEVFSLLN